MSLLSFLRLILQVPYYYYYYYFLKLVMMLLWLNFPSYGDWGQVQDRMLVH